MGESDAVRAVPEADWARLRVAAADALERAYAPYSGYRVGAAALTEDGRLVAGCNVENASHGVTLCAECALVGELHMGGGGRLVAFVCLGGDGRVITPCGRCRQLLWEFHAPGMAVLTPAGVLPVDALLPQAFGPEDLAAASQ